MKIETRKVGDVTVLDCSGKITLGEGTMAVRNSVCSCQLFLAKQFVEVHKLGQVVEKGEAH